MKNIFVDSDGTLTQFYQDKAYLDKMYIPGYFQNLLPYASTLDAVNRLLGDNTVQLCILSAISCPHETGEKQEWLRRYLAKPVPVLFLPSGGSKSAKVCQALHIAHLTQDHILLDDHTPNLLDWQQAGGRAVKFVNEINHTGSSGIDMIYETISMNDKATEICRVLKK